MFIIVKSQDENIQISDATILADLAAYVAILTDIFVYILMRKILKSNLICLNVYNCKRNT